MTIHWGGQSVEPLQEALARYLKNLSTAGGEFCAKHGSLTKSLGRLQRAAVSLCIIIVISAEIALPKGLLSSEGFDLVEKFIVNIIFRPSTKESSSIWRKHDAIKQET